MVQGDLVICSGGEKQWMLDKEEAKWYVTVCKAE